MKRAAKASKVFEMQSLGGESRLTAPARCNGAFDLFADRRILTLFPGVPAVVEVLRTVKLSNSRLFPPFRSLCQGFPLPLAYFFTLSPNCLAQGDYFILKVYKS